MSLTVKQLASTTLPNSAKLYASYSNYNEIIKLSDTKAVIIYTQSGQGYAQVCDINVDGSITLGTAYAFNLASTTATYFSACMIDSTRFLITYKDETNSDYGTAIIGTITLPNTITFGSEYVFKASSTSNTSCCLIDVDKIFIAYRDEVSTYAKSIVGTIANGNELTFGTEYAINATDSRSISVDTVSTDKVCITYSNSSTGNPETLIGNITGTDIAFGSIYALTSIGASSAERNIKTIALTSTSVLIVIKISTYIEYAIIATITGDVITFDNLQYTLGPNYFSSATVDTLSSTEFIATLKKESLGNTICEYYKINGSNITLISSAILNAYTGAIYSNIGAIDVDTILVTDWIGSDTSNYYINTVKVVSDVIIKGGEVTTIVTGVTGGHTEISSIYITNNSATDITVRLFVGGTGADPIYTVLLKTITANNTEHINLANNPIILEDGVTLRGNHDSADMVTIQCYGLEEV